jgi:hypothetical protein
VPVVTQMEGQRGVDAHEALDPMHHAGPQPQRDRRFSGIHKFSPLARQISQPQELRAKCPHIDLEALNEVTGYMCQSCGQADNASTETPSRHCRECFNNGKDLSQGRRNI